MLLMAFLLAFPTPGVLCAYRAEAASLKKAEAPGKTVYKEKTGSADISNIDSGYIVVKYAGDTKLKVRITGTTAYTYDVTEKNKEYVIPVTEGSGTYTIELLENAYDDMYASLLKEDVKVNIKDETEPFLYPNMFSNITSASPIVKKADSLADPKDTLKTVGAIYDYVVANVKYDNDKTSSVQAGYIPDPEDTFKTNKGICFDYASLATAMLRAEGIPTKLQVGYAGKTYHAWISVWTREKGWVDKIIEFKGKSWTLMDPTFHSTGKKKAEKFITDSTNYTVQYNY